MYSQFPRTVLILTILAILLLPTTMVRNKTGDIASLIIAENQFYDELESFIVSEMETRHIPGLSAAVVLYDDVIWDGAFGMADIERNIVVTNETLFKIASVSKTVTATALMQLYEQGLFDLYDAINKYLPFQVIHPNYPSTNITFHMLLTHSSGICDNWDYLFHFVGDAPIPFQLFLEEYLHPGGDYYNANNNFCSYEPGTGWRYSNIAVALIGYLVEVISNTNFSAYCQSALFNPLDMDESGWYLRDLNVSNIAIPYKWSSDEFLPYGHIGYVDVPAGDLRTSSLQLSHFLTMIINNGRYNSQHILMGDTIDLMLTPQLHFNDKIGLIWWKSSIDGRTVWGHNGADYGCRASMQFDPETKIGVVVLINGESGTSRIANRLFEYAEAILHNHPPEKPMYIQGPSDGNTNIEYSYSTTVVDADGDQIYYYWSWGDGTNSGWLGPYESDKKITASHSWSSKGSYEIKVKAKDVNGAESDWSDPLPVSMPLSHQTLLERIIEWILQIFGITIP